MINLIDNEILKQTFDCTPPLPVEPWSISLNSKVSKANFDKDRDKHAIKTCLPIPISMVKMKRTSGKYKYNPNKQKLI